MDLIMMDLNIQIMENDYIVCVTNEGMASSQLLEVGEKYHVEEAFNLETEKADKDPEITKRILANYPNPFFYLKEFHNTCSCCGERVFFWHGLFQTQKQLHNGMEKIA